MARPPPSFVRYYDLLKSYVSDAGHSAPANGRNGLRLFMGPKTLADRGETSDEFAQAALEIGVQTHAFSYLLKRAGFYNLVLSDASVDKLWSRLDERHSALTYRVDELFLLDGCGFPRDCFSIYEHTVRKFSQSEIIALGPPTEIAEVFFPKEQLDPDWYCQQWFLCERHYVPHDECDIELESYGLPKLNSPFGCSRSALIEELLKPLLVLALFDVPCFHIPLILESEAQYRLTLVELDSIHKGVGLDEHGEYVAVPHYDYSIDKDRWSRFRGFMLLLEKGISKIEAWRTFRIAARRFLKATFLTYRFTQPWELDDLEDILLQYVFGLEAMLSAGDKEAITDKISIRASLLAGRDDEERIEFYRRVKRAYNLRSVVAHGKGEAFDYDEFYEDPLAYLQDLRDVFRRVFAVLLVSTKNFEKEKIIGDLLRELPLSRKRQDLIAELRQETVDLLSSVD